MSISRAWNIFFVLYNTDHSQSHAGNFLSGISFVDVVIPISVRPFSMLYVLLMLYSIVLADLVAEVVRL
jgi:hypothetical protein